MRTGQGIWILKQDIVDQFGHLLRIFGANVPFKDFFLRAVDVSPLPKIRALVRLVETTDRIKPTLFHAQYLFLIFPENLYLGEGDKFLAWWRKLINFWTVNVIFGTLDNSCFKAIKTDLPLVEYFNISIIELMRNIYCSLKTKITFLSRLFFWFDKY